MFFKKFTEKPHLIKNNLEPLLPLSVMVLNFFFLSRYNRTKMINFQCCKPLKILTPSFHNFIFKSGSEPVPGKNSSLNHQLYSIIFVN